MLFRSSDVPVAVGPLVTVKQVNGKIVYEPQQDPNDVAYRVGGIPQIHLIDKKGNMILDIGDKPTTILGLCRSTTVDNPCAGSAPTNG